MPKPRSRKRSTNGSSPPDQSVAGRLPVEIVDCIFQNFDFDYSIDAREDDRTVREVTLSSVATVLRGWTTPARKYLFRNVSIRDWPQLCAGVKDWARIIVRTLRIYGTTSFDADAAQETCAKIVFRLISRLPNLHSLDFYRLPFSRFTTADSKTLRSTPLFSSLSSVSIYTASPARSILSDLLVTSNRNIRSVTYWDYNNGSHWTDDEEGEEDALNIEADSAVEDLHFGGNVRKLDLSEVRGYESIVEPGLMVGLAGLQQLIIRRHLAPSKVEELFEILAPTLEKLKVDGSIIVVAPYLRQLEALTHLNLDSEDDYYSMTAALLSLPPNLNSLSLSSDEDIRDLLRRTPPVLPSTLRHLRLHKINETSTLTGLPPLTRLITKDDENYDHVIGKYLSRTMRGRPSFKNLEIIYDPEDDADTSKLMASCKRLGIGYTERPGMENDDDNL